MTNIQIWITDHLGDYLLSYLIGNGKAKSEIYKTEKEAIDMAMGLLEENHPGNAETRGRGAQ